MLLYRILSLDISYRTDRKDEISFVSQSNNTFQIHSLRRLYDKMVTNDTVLKAEKGDR
jgi:hypothetical protein